MSKSQMNFLLAVGAVVVGGIVFNTAQQAFRSTTLPGKILRGTWF